VSITQWQRLEARVQHLETWAGPGQVQALLDGQQELRTGLAKAQGTLARHERLLTGLKTDMAAVKQTQGQHSAALAAHTAILAEHTAILAEHTALLAWMKQALTELLARIPEQPRG
jgi:hypothetical protein